MEITDLISASFDRLPYPIAGMVILLVLAMLSLTVSWQRKLWIAMTILWVGILIILSSSIKEEFELGRGDGFGRLFLVFHGFALFIYGIIVSICCGVLSARKRAPQGHDELQAKGASE